LKAYPTSIHTNRESTSASLNGNSFLFKNNNMNKEGFTDSLEIDSMLLREALESPNQN
jgi:hypothetical protein